MSQRGVILLVEDNPDLRDRIELLLLRQGYQVVATGDGLRAVELAEQTRVDAALVDLLVPGQSGFQVTLALKERHGDRVRVVVMSGHTSPAHQAYALATGAERFLAKPFRTEELLETLAAVCPPPAIAEAPRRTARVRS